MPSIKDIGKRLKGVTSTSKITKAMKLVAASKLRQAESKMLAARPFAASMQELMLEHLTPKEDDTISNSIMLAVSSDKGLCGGINSRVVKQVKLHLAAQPETTSTTVMIMGGKVRDGLNRTHSSFFSTTFDETYKGPVTFSLASFIAEQMIATPADSYNIMYNKFQSVLAQDVTTMAIKSPEALGGSGVMDEYEFEGEKEEVLANLYQFNLAATLYGCILENVTSENASRMTAMDSASNNAKDMIGKLQIQYNRLRQAKITTELTEIVAGAESV